MSGDAMHFCILECDAAMRCAVRVDLARSRSMHRDHRSVAVATSLAPYLGDADFTSKPGCAFSSQHGGSVSTLLCEPRLRAHGQRQRGWLAAANGRRRTTGTALALEAGCGQRGADIDILGADVQAAPRYPGRSRRSQRAASSAAGTGRARSCYCWRGGPSSCCGRPCTR